MSILQLFFNQSIVSDLKQKMTKLQSREKRMSSKFTVHSAGCLQGHAWYLGQQGQHGGEQGNQGGERGQRGVEHGCDWCGFHWGVTIYRQYKLFDR